MTLSESVPQCFVVVAHQLFIFNPLLPNIKMTLSENLKKNYVLAFLTACDRFKKWITLYHTFE